MLLFELLPLISSFGVLISVLLLCMIDTVRTHSRSISIFPENPAFVAMWKSFHFLHLLITELLSTFSISGAFFLR